MREIKICTIGLGYIGLPLSIKLSKKFNVIGYDIDFKRVKELKNNCDCTNEVSKKELIKSKILFSNKVTDIINCNFFIITVPTPVTKSKKPDLGSLINATRMLGKILKKNDVVVYESTTFPGCTDEICIPLLEKISKLKINKDFWCGFSPERMNPGDKINKLSKINKIISSTNTEGLNKIDKIYKNITSKKIIKVSSIKIAESAKIIENIQRDINIALMNELSMLFNVMNIDFTKVLKAASTKWNFLNFKPGIVGGHCISVDPYYLADKARKVNFKTNLILSGREINDHMSNYISKKFIQIFNKKNLPNKRILIIGTTFKENVPDTRNSQSIKIINKLNKNNFKISTFDPIKNIDLKNVNNIKNFNMLSKYQNYFSGILILVPHDAIKKKGSIYYEKLLKKNNVFFDIKNIFDKKNIDFKL